MAYAKVIFNGTTLIDITQDTATASEVNPGYTFHGADGNQYTGTDTSGISIVEVPDVGGGTIMQISGDATTIEPITITENGMVAAPSGKAYSPVTVNVSGSSVPEVTIATSGAVVATLDPNKAYHFTSDAITSLTISFSGTQAEQYHFDFISPATAVQLTLPSFVIMEQYFSVEANTKLEIDITNGYGVYAEWAYEVT